MRVARLTISRHGGAALRAAVPYGSVTTAPVHLGRLLRPSGWALALALLLPLHALAAARARGDAPPAGVVQEWLTSADRSHLLDRVADLALGAADPPVRPGFVAPVIRGAIVEVDARQTFQEMTGFGAAITDASAWLLQNRMAPRQRDALLRELFSRDLGLGLGMTRISIGSSDFSLRHYSLDDMPAGQRDPDMAHFSIEPMRAAVIPVLKAAHAVNPRLRVIASPWSAPLWMKTSSRLGSGTLRPDSYESFARYLVRTATALHDEGLGLFALTVQNEPHFEPDDYPGMRLGPRARANFVGGYLGPLLHEKAPGVQILEWDHNWDEPSSPLRALSDETAEPYIDGVAWHCYRGDVVAQSRVHDRYPDKDVYITECSGGDWRARWDSALPWLARTLIVGGTRNWASGVVLWNLALDENHGPHVGGCTDCRGVVTIDSRTGEVQRNPEYYVLGQASRFVHPGALRVQSTGEAGSAQTVAFRNGDEGTTVLIVVNSGGREQALYVRSQGQAFQASVPPYSIATFRWAERPAQ